MIWIVHEQERRSEAALKMARFANHRNGPRRRQMLKRQRHLPNDGQLKATGQPVRSLAAVKASSPNVADYERPAVTCRRACPLPKREPRPDSHFPQKSRPKAFRCNEAS